MASGMRAPRRANRRRVWGPGIVAGLVSAVAMALLAMIVAAANGAGFFAPMKLIAATFLGSAAMTAGGGAILLGMVTHLVVGAFFGVVFASILSGDAGPGMRFVSGLLYGLGIFIVMTIFIMPLINTTMATHIDVIWFMIDHLVYGFTLSLVVPAVRAGGRGMQRPAHA